ncbi:MAG: outer membrane lipoprotein-sorting protein [Capsulimonadaceae bacterium]
MIAGNRLRGVPGICGLFLAAALRSMGAAPVAPPDISQLTSAKIRTLTMDTYVVTENRPELQKIGGDFADAYRFHNVSVTYMQPDMLQFDSVVAGTHITYTINGNRKFTSIPSFHVHHVEDTTGAPGKKQSLLDMGMIPPELLTLYNGTYLRTEGKLYVFQIMPKQASETYKDIVWIDPVTHITVKRIHYNRDGKLIAWYRYLDPAQPRPRIYVPSRVEVYNPEGHLAAVTQYSNIKVNLAVDQTIFQF